MAQGHRAHLTIPHDARVALDVLAARNGTRPMTEACRVLVSGLQATIQSAAVQVRLSEERLRPELADSAPENGLCAVNLATAEGAEEL